MNNEDILPQNLLKEKEEFDKFYNKYSKYILKIISQILICNIERQYIEECFDDVIIKIFDNLSEINTIDSLNSWVASIAKNTALDYKRKLKKLFLETEMTETLISQFDIEKNYLDKQLGGEIKYVINQLKDSEKELIIKKYILDYSTDELCKYYFINQDSLYKRLSRVREKFKKIWISNKYGDEKINE